MGNIPSTSSSSQNASDVTDLQKVLRTVSTNNNGSGARAHDHYHLVYPRIYVGGYQIARDVSTLQRLGVTHVLNCTDQLRNEDFVPLPKLYKTANIKYLELGAVDIGNYDLSKHFDQSIAFIDEALVNSSVLVHCQMGFSRSPAIVTAYLMKRHNMSAATALSAIRSRRIVHPNYGFLQLLADYDRQLRSEASMAPKNTRNTTKRSWDSVFHCCCCCKASTPKLDDNEFTDKLCDL